MKIRTKKELAELFSEHMVCECCPIYLYCARKASLTCEEVWFKYFIEEETTEHA